MDAFFASVELLRYPELRGRAMVVGGRDVRQPVEQADGSHQFARLADYVGRGVITTSTYEARALGVFSGMGLMKAAKLAPDAVLLPANFAAYRHYSQRFKAAVGSLVPTIEDRGIDEIYIDFAGLAEASAVLAGRIKAAVFAATGLTCSIGVAPNKLLAKICSDLDKPDGLTILPLAEVPTRIWPLAARKINGIGPKATEKLGRLGIHSIGELAAAPLDLLLGEFGQNTGRWLHRAAHGIDERPVITASTPKSISRETTFDRDLHAQQDRAALSGIFTALCLKLAGDLADEGYACKTVGIKLRFSDFRAVTRDLTLPAAITSGEAIRKAAGECLKRVPLAQRIRLLGVRAGNLIAVDALAGQSVCRQAELPF